MPLTASLAPRRATLRALALALMITTLPLTSTRAGETSRSAPPHHPDATHVWNGCYLSTVAYLARFHAEFPDETGQPVNVIPPNSDSVTPSHTIALVSWHGRWFGRDEYFGVFPANCAVGDGGVTDAIVRKITLAFDWHATALAKAGRITLPVAAPKRLAAAERSRLIAVAKEMVPFAVEQFWVRSGDTEMPFLFFRPAAGTIAVYDPLTGTAQAECSLRGGAKVVAAVAARLGYRVDAVRPEFGPLADTLLASVETKSGGLGR